MAGTALTAVLGASVVASNGIVSITTSELRTIAYNAGFIDNNSDPVDSFEDLVYLILCAALQYKKDNPTPASNCNFNCVTAVNFSPGSLNIETDGFYRTGTTLFKIPFTITLYYPLSLTAPTLSQL